MDLASAIIELENQSVLWHQRPQAILSMKGPDAKIFLERMSTNDMAALIKGPVATSLINSKGRMVDYAVVFSADDGLLLLSSHQQPQILIDWLEKFHFIEDFAVSIEQELSCFYVLGKVFLGSGATIHSSAFSLPKTDAHFYVLLAKNPPAGINMGEDIFETLRIASLMPLAPFEINDRFMPQNINLLDSIAQKGCYIGQEVILKALTYQKNAKKLSGLKLSLEEWLRLGPSPELLSRSPLYWEGFFNALIIQKDQER